MINNNKYARKIFWEKVQETTDRLSSACGCYLFAIRAAKGIKPWYIGLAAKQSFERECFAPTKINIYNDSLASKKGTPILFLIARRTSKDKFAKPGKNGHKDIEYLESIMIGMALDKNPELLNIKKTGFLRRMCVPCIVNTPKGPPSKPEGEFKKAMGIVSL